MTSISRIVIGPTALVACLACAGWVLGACAEIAPNDTLVDVVIDEPCDFADCGPFGRCVADVSGEPSCLCELGFQGTACDVCAVNFHRDAAEQCVPDKRCAELDGNPCAPHGHCIDEIGVVACDCDIGYEGPRCELCVDEYGRDGYGRCLPLQLSLGSPAAVLPDDAIDCPPGYQGDVCTYCAEGFHREDDACAMDESCDVGGCPENSTCVLVDGRVTCACDEGYEGESCTLCTAGHHARDDTCVLDETCEGEGGCPATASCRIVAGRVDCLCNTGYAGEACDACATGYHREGAACVVDEACLASTCSSTASCAVVSGEAVCSCHVGYQGAGCSDCVEGYHRDGSVCERDAYCTATSCPDNSYCSVVAGFVECTCKDGWGPESECDVCEGYTTERTGFEFPTGWPITQNLCLPRSSLSVSGMTFESRALADGSNYGDVQRCSKSTFADIDDQHVQLEIYPGEPALITFDEPAFLLAMDFGAIFMPLDFEVRAETEPVTVVRPDGSQVRDVDPGAEIVGHVQLPVRSRDTLTIRFDPPVRVLTLWSVNGERQRLAVDNILYTYANCDR